MNRLRGFMVLIACVFSLVGCGYHFGDTGPGPMPGMTRVAIPIFENKSFESQVESLFTVALRRQFMMRGHVQIVPAEDAEVIFKGKVISIIIADIAHLVGGNTLETRVTANLDIRCIDAKTGAIIWQDKNLSYSSSYLQSPNPTEAFDGRHNALENCAQEIATRVFDRFYSNF